MIFPDSPKLTLKPYPVVLYVRSAACRFPGVSRVFPVAEHRTALKFALKFADAHGKPFKSVSPSLPARFRQPTLHLDLRILSPDRRSEIRDARYDYTKIKVDVLISKLARECRPLFLFRLIVQNGLGQYFGYSGRKCGTPSIERFLDCRGTRSDNRSLYPRKSYRDRRSPSFCW